MTHRKASPGTCRYCGKQITRQGITRHLAACAERWAAVAEVGARGGKPVHLHHLRVQDAWSGDYWLDLEMPGARTLADLDRYLRAIWLECCGHMSQFSIGGWGGQEIPMSRKIYAAFDGDVELTHIYDFGTESVTLVKAITQREGVPTTRHPIALMARNLPPGRPCGDCGKPARWLCLECIGYGGPGTLCDEHAESHPHDDYGEPLPLVNSPRAGMCGYDGPAKPPY